MMILQTVTPEQCAADMMTVVPTMTRFLRAELRRHGEPGLSLSQLRVLYFLKRQPQSSLSEVADYLDVAHSTMSVMVERLVQRGLVQRLEVPQERRRVALSLTSEGVARMEQVYAATLRSLAQKFSNLSEEQMLQTTVGLTILGDLFVDF